MHFFRFTIVVLILTVLGPGDVFSQTCTRGDFAAVVDEAGAALRTLNKDHTPIFQAKLRALRAKRGWDQKTFLAMARVFVEDPRISSYDEKAERLIRRINNLGDDDTNSGTDCALLATLRLSLDLLVDTMEVKWAYMHAQVDGALER